jgi:hypothetical protein
MVELAIVTFFDVTTASLLSKRAATLARFICKNQSHQYGEFLLNRTRRKPAIVRIMRQQSPISAIAHQIPEHTFRASALIRMTAPSLWIRARADGTSWRGDWVVVVVVSAGVDDAKLEEVELDWALVKANTSQPAKKESFMLIATMMAQGQRKSKI